MDALSAIQFLMKVGDNSKLAKFIILEKTENVLVEKQIPILIFLVKKMEKESMFM